MEGHEKTTSIVQCRCFWEGTTPGHEEAPNSATYEGNRLRFCPSDIPLGLTEHLCDDLEILENKLQFLLPLEGRHGVKEGSLGR